MSKYFLGGLSCIVIAVFCFLLIKDCKGPENIPEPSPFVIAPPDVDTVGRQVVFSQSVGVIESQETIKKLTDSLKLFKTVLASTSAELRIAYRKQRVPFVNPSVVVVARQDSGPDKKALLLPARLAASDSTFALAAIIDSAGLLIDSLVVYSHPTITVGEPRRSILARLSGAGPSLLIAYTDRNPHAQVTGLKSVLYQAKKKWYEKPWVYLAAGGITGALLFK